jgi:N-acetylneuraminate epimerase
VESEPRWYPQLEEGVRVRIVSLIGVVLFVIPQTQAREWERLPPLPDREGFAGSFAGVTHGVLLVAGGSNFPDKKPWEGGKKAWYDAVRMLEKPNGEWREVGRLPRPLAYGVSVTHGDSVICVGGSNAVQHFAEAFRLEWKAGELRTTRLSPLPRPVANAGGVLVGDVLYIVGGQESPDARTTLHTVYRMDLSAVRPVWSEVERWPGPARMLAVTAGFDGKLWFVGGADLVRTDRDTVARRYLRDAYCYAPSRGWKQLADAPYPVVAAPSPAPVYSSGFYVLGGDDGSQVGAAPDRHCGFRTTILRFDARTGRWSEAGSTAAPNVTVPCLFWQDRWIIPSGEIRPGVRSPEVWGWKPPAEE